MKRVLKYFLIICFFAIYSCHKYQNGGWTNRAKKHLVSGEFGFGTEWKLIYYAVNSNDSLAYVKTCLKNYINIYDLSFTPNHNDRSKFNCSHGFVKYDCKFGNSKSSILFTSKTNFSNCSPGCSFEIFNPLNLSTEVLWKIDKLTSKYLWVSYWNQNNYVARFVKFENTN